mmetsp:Transcript_13129/g.35115  ORF Transcript_13129/g.35115 Transcript_13129/m.35115 type:complete len:208 (+) Transcript_13129:2662-3285(+)
MHAAFPTSSPEVFHSQLVTRELVLTSMPQHTRRRVNDRPRQRTQGQQFPFAVARITENTAPPSQRAFTAPAYTAAGLPPPPDTQGKNPRAILNTTALAFLGDSVWEVLLRTFVMEAYPTLQAGTPSPLHSQVHDEVPATGPNLASSMSTTSKQPKTNPARTQRKSGRDLTVAARAKANATQQANYFDYLWATSSAHAKGRRKQVRLL